MRRALPSTPPASRLGWSFLRRALPSTPPVRWSSWGGRSLLSRWYNSAMLLAQSQRRRQAGGPAWLMILLSAGLPGAVLACILHCSLPAFPAYNAASPFLCGHMLLAEPERLPPPISLSLFQGLIQALPTTEGTVSWPLMPALPLVILPLIVIMAQAMPPPEPPPRQVSTTPCVGRKCSHPEPA